MNKNIFEGKWHEVSGKVKEKWGKLTDDDLTQINGKREKLLGKIQSRYGYAQDKAERELSEFEKSFNQNANVANKSNASSSNKYEKQRKV